jgi:hypothetical protein
MDAKDTVKVQPTEHVEEALDEHRECMMLVAELEACLDRRPEPAKEWVAAVQDCLGRLRGALSEHFKDETEGWLYREMPLRRPRFAPALERLEAEHPEILADLDVVAKKAGSLNDPERHHLRELAGHLQLLTARLRRHEAEENEILIAAAVEDTGQAG